MFYHNRQEVVKYQQSDFSLFSFHPSFLNGPITALPMWLQRIPGGRLLMHAEGGEVEREREGFLNRRLVVVVSTR